MVRIEFCFLRTGFGFVILNDFNSPNRPEISVAAFTTSEVIYAACLAGKKSQLTAVELDGLPPSRSDLYTNKVVTKAYPGFAGLVKESIEGAGPRPTTPAYQDVSSALQRTLHPPEKIDPEDTEPTYDELKSNLEAAVKREGLL